MAYTRTNWVTSETPLSAANFNNIEDGIEEALEKAERGTITVGYGDATVSLPASDSVEVTVNMAKADHTFLGIIGIYPSGTGSSLGYLFKFYKSGNNAVIGLRNSTSGARSYSIRVYGLYIHS